MRNLSWRGEEATKQSSWNAPARCAHLALTMVAASAFGLTTPARAHDPSESWTSVTVRPEGMDLLVTMAQSNARKLIDPTNKLPPFAPETFAQHRPRLVEAGAALFTITSLKSRIRSGKVEVELTEENDVTFKISYPRPAPGLLLLEAAFLKKLGEGCGGIIDASDTVGHHLGWDQLSPDHATLVVVLPEPKQSS